MTKKEEKAPFDNSDNGEGPALEIIERTPINLATKNDLEEFFNLSITEDRLKSLTILYSGKVPEYAVRKHPGAQGKTFSYVDHVWVTQLLRDSFGPFWSFKNLEATIEEDGTASAKSELSVKFPMPNGIVFENSFIEMGACLTTTGMSLANRKLSAVSKSLVRCAFRMFGVGQEFYNTIDMEGMTNEQAWTIISLYIAKNPKYIKEEEVVEYCKANKITGDRTAECFEEIYGFVGLTVAQRKIKEKIGK
jgi:hypothetical protein